MLRGVLSLFQREDVSAPAPPATALPAELVLAIESAEVYWRPSRADDAEAGPIVRIVGMGSWVFRDVEDAADRVARAYPDLPRNMCLRAGHLVWAQVGRRNAEARDLRAGARPDRPLTTDYMEP